MDYISKSINESIQILYTISSSISNNHALPNKEICTLYLFIYICISIGNTLFEWIKKKESINRELREDKRT